MFCVYVYVCARLCVCVQAMDLVGFRAKLLLEEGSFEPQGLSMMLTGLAAVDYRNHLLLSAAASVATLRMDEFTPQVRTCGHITHLVARDSC